MIEVNGREAKITRIWNDYAWRLQFTDTNEIVNVFYWREEEFKLRHKVINEA